MNARTAVFAAVCLAQLAVPAYMIARAERTRAEGRVWRFRTAPVDPSDLVRGRYVRLAFQATSGPRAGEAELASGQRAYALVEEDEQGFARIAGVSAAPPEGDAWFETRVRDVRGERVTIVFPVDRFYLPEGKARDAELLVLGAGRTAWAELRVHRGRVEVDDVLVDGVPLLRAVEPPPPPG